MSKSILVMGESGSGKTTAMRNLPPSETFYFDVDGKGLNWKGWRKDYNAQNKNYLNMMRMNIKDKSIADIIIETMWTLSKKHPQVKFIVIDTINSMMVYSEMTDKRKSFSKWTDIAEDGYSVCLTASRLRDDLTVIVLGHSETITEDDGLRFTRLKTNGRKLEKIVLESLFTTVLLADKVIGENGQIRHVLIANQINSSAKAPMGSFEDPVIDNDITIAIEKIKDY